MNALTRLWTQSILFRVGGVLGLMTLVALAVIVVAAVLANQSTGKASAINSAGALRMQSYSMSTRVASLPMMADGTSEAYKAIEGVETRLRNPGLVEALPASGDDALRRDYDQIVGEWEREVRPLALAAIADPAMRGGLVDRIDRFVERVDPFVALLERDAEARIQELRLWLAVALLAILALAVTAIVLLRVEVFRPLSDLLRSARAVRTGSFKARVNATGTDQMGQLAQAFNLMVERLARMYGSLEKQVAEKTVDLERKNQSLGLLYEATQLLSERPLDIRRLRTVLASLSRALGAEDAVICARHTTSARGLPLAGDESLRAEIFERRRCAGCSNEGKLESRTEMTDRGEQRIINVPLLDGGVTYGVMPLRLPPGRGLESWQLELAQTVGRHIGAALAAAEQREEHQRLALLEERSAIARELHDSLAQSLSYTRIQLTRLSALLGSGGDHKAAQAVLDELREGVSSVNRQLRELLTTFRMKVGGASFDKALREVITEFERRSGLPLIVRGDLTGVEPAANAQVHVLQILREALTNIEKHARARSVIIELQHDAASGVSLIIEDDGVGIATHAPPAQHFGLEIMRDRTRLLGGTIAVARHGSGGTRVLLRFPMPTGLDAQAATSASVAAPTRETV